MPFFANCLQFVCKPRLFLLILISVAIITFYLCNERLSYSVLVHSFLIHDSRNRSHNSKQPNLLPTSGNENQKSATTTRHVSTTIKPILPYVYDVLNLSSNVRQRVWNDFAAPARLCEYPPPKNVLPGGFWEPPHCAPRWRIAVVIPFRNREAHLRVFLNVYHAFFQKHLIAYRIFVVEQNGTTPFNRAMLFNVGFYEALRTVDAEFSLAQLAKLANVFMSGALSWQDTFENVSRNSTNLFNRTSDESDNRVTAQTLLKMRARVARFMDTFECFVFHDVDLLPEDDRNLYSCPLRDPRHLSVAIDKFNYELLYPGLFGGASAIGLAHFLKVNGFSNTYFDWGGEDDDFAARVVRYWRIERFPKEVARYTMLTGKGHNSAQQNPKRWQLLRDASARFPTDGLNSLTGRFDVLERRNEPLFTYIRVHLYEPHDVRGIATVILPLW